VTVAWHVPAPDGKQDWIEEDLSGSGRFLRAFGAIGPDAQSCLPIRVQTKTFLLLSLSSVVTPHSGKTLLLSRSDPLTEVVSK